MNTNAKARLSQIAGHFSENRKSENQNSEKVISENLEKPCLIEANRPHGQKSNFVKVCVTLPPEIYEGLVSEVTKRKVGKMGNAQLSAVVREAAVAFLEG